MQRRSGGLRAARSDLEILQRKVDSLNKEVDAEREFGVAMKAQVDMPTRHLEDAKTVGLVVVELYVGALEQFGGSTSSLPSNPSTFSIFSWMKANFLKLPDFVGGAIDFGELASATNLSKMLRQDGCLHIKGVKEKDLEGPTELRVTTHDARRSVCNFMKSFWVKFGRMEARSMVEARRAAVCYFFFPPFVTC